MNNSTSCVSINVQDILFNLAKQKDERIFYFLEKDKTLINIQDGNELSSSSTSFLSFFFFFSFYLKYCKSKLYELEEQNYSKNKIKLVDSEKENILMTNLKSVSSSNNSEDIKNEPNIKQNIINNNLYTLHKNKTYISIRSNKEKNLYLKFSCLFIYLFIYFFFFLTFTFHMENIEKENKEENYLDRLTNLFKYLTLGVEKNNSTEKNSTHSIKYDGHKNSLQQVVYNLKLKRASELSVPHRILGNTSISKNGYTYIYIYIYIYIFFFFARKYINGQQLYLDLFHPFLFVIYYFVVTSNPGYLENNKNNVPNINLEGKKKKDMNMKCRNGDNDKDTYNDVDTKDEEYKDKPLNDYDKKANNKERPKENITFQYIIKNITDEINRYERKYKLVEFAKRIKKENIFELKNSMEINWDIPPIEFTEINMNMLCPTCFLFKNIRTKHCSLCDKCVEIFDHHCDFTLNCMGIENARIFLLWILLNIFFSFSIIYIYGWFIFNSSLNYYNIKFYIILMAIVLSILIIYFMGAIFIRSIMNILENITSNEKFKIYTYKTFFTYELTMDEKKQPTVIRKFKNPFDQGMLFNFINFLTKSKTKLIKKEKQFIIIDKNIKSQKLTEFVDKLNKRLNEMNIE
ncbi:hypothetical protein PFNF54_04310 [Plasmodium falciparum NF54]|uniref:Palmitoyltransferase n=1 Tax=Plasmodium falciparum (isolate NF54) TaxID=5843 RepID=W7KAU2_PLAFO|nr:hypothetical protein PFNF54_04310 [Plasmodium falciparum NF54]